MKSYKENMVSAGLMASLYITVHMQREGGKEGRREGEGGEEGSGGEKHCTWH